MSTRTLFRAAGFYAVGTIGFALMSGAALAHPGHAVSNNVFLDGLLHPLTGFDHLLAMLAVGMWAALTHKDIRHAIWTPVSFLCLLFVGALIGLTGASLPPIEPMIMASLFVLGLLLAIRVSMPAWASAALVGFFALFHGMAHGSELAAGASAAPFIAGFMLSTFALHAIGLAGGFALKQHGQWLTRIAGTGIAAYGVVLFAYAA